MWYAEAGAFNYRNSWATFQGPETAAHLLTSAATQCKVRHSLSTLRLVTLMYNSQNHMVRKSTVL